MFSIRLKELRENAGYNSQQAFADAFGVAQSTVAGWETGKREPNYETTKRLARFFGVSVDELLGTDSSFGQCLYMRALRNYCAVCGKDYDKIVSYYEKNPQFVQKRLSCEPLTLPERLELEQILGMPVIDALGLGCIGGHSLDSYADIFDTCPNIVSNVGSNVAFGASANAAILSAYRSASPDDRAVVDAALRKYMDKSSPLSTDHSPDNAAI